MINAREISEFERRGLVTVPTGIANELLDGANSEIERLCQEASLFDLEDDSRGWYNGEVLEPCLVDLALHPFFETTAAQLLRANEVELADVSMRVTPPRPDAAFRFEREHVDFKCTTGDYTARPARMVCGFFLWLTDVQSDCCPLYFRPGSHLQVLEYVDSYPDSNNHRYKQAPPDLVYQERVAVLAKRGDASILSGTLVHCGSVTPGAVERRLLVIEYKAKGADFPFYIQTQETRVSYLTKLASHAPKNRNYLLPGVS